MNKLASDGTIQWLLGADHPPVRYLTLVHLLGRNPESPEVRDARGHLMDYEVTRKTAGPDLHLTRRRMAGSDLHLTGRIFQADLPAPASTHRRGLPTSLLSPTRSSARSRSALAPSTGHGKWEKPGHKPNLACCRGRDLGYHPDSRERCESGRVPMSSRSQQTGSCRGCLCDAY